MTVEHPSERLVTRYARGEVDIPADEVWAVEAHLESCSACRARLADVVEGSTAALVDLVWTDLEPRLLPRPRPRRHLRRLLAAWITPAMVPWLVMSTVVTLLALLLDPFSQSTDEVSLVLLLAPVLPVLGVAASWAKGLDPMHEIVASTPRAGLYLLLRRTVSVLLVVIPTLLITTGRDSSTALWLLPCLAFTTATLALGGLVGITRAAVGLIAVWVAVIFAPSVVLHHPSFALHENGLPVWGALFVLGALVVAARRSAYTDLGARR